MGIISRYIQRYQRHLPQGSDFPRAAKASRTTPLLTWQNPSSPEQNRSPNSLSEYLHNCSNRYRPYQTGICLNATTGQPADTALISNLTHINTLETTTASTTLTSAGAVYQPGFITGGHMWLKKRWHYSGQRKTCSRRNRALFIESISSCGHRVALRPAL